VIDQCENRKFTSSKLTELLIPVTPWTVASTVDEAVAQCKEIGYPVLIRPSFVLGGRGMKIIYDESSLASYLSEAVLVTPELPVYIDKFLQEAKEIDVDAVCDGKEVFHVVMEQIEHAGVHSGDSACVLPPQSLSNQVIATIKEYTETIALEFGIIGLMNIQFAVKHDDVYVLEINPRASRTVPFASKAINLPLAKIGTSVMLGKSLKETLAHYQSEHLGRTNITPSSVCVKEVVLPFRKLQLDPILSPEMQSTGEVIGVGETIGEAFFKAQCAAGNTLATSGSMFLSLADSAKDAIPAIAVKLRKLPFKIYTTEGTGKSLKRVGVDAIVIKKISEGSPNILDIFAEASIDLLVNIPESRAEAQNDALIMRQYVVDYQVPFISSLPALRAALEAIAVERNRPSSTYQE
jgi:carbamoyl-phosphate synthase large subunit